MGNSLSAGLAVTGLMVLVLGMAVPVIVCGQQKNDRRPTAANAVERSEALASGAESGSVSAAKGTAQPNSALPSATSYDWEGGYIGGHVGWGRGRADTTFTPLPTAVQFIDLAPTSLR